MTDGDASSSSVMNDDESSSVMMDDVDSSSVMADDDQSSLMNDGESLSDCVMMTPVACGDIKSYQVISCQCPS